MRNTNGQFREHLQENSIICICEGGTDVNSPAALIWSVMLQSIMHMKKGETELLAGLINMLYTNRMNNRVKVPLFS